MSLKQDYVTVKKLTALAQLVIIYAERGITSTKQLCELTGYSDRQIRRAKADAGDRTPASATRTPVAGQAAPECRSGSTLPPLKKGLPHTPSKEITPPSPDSTIPEEARSLGRSSQFQEFDQQTIRDLAGLLKTAPVPAKSFLDGQVQVYGWQITNTAVARFRARVAGGEVFTRPLSIFNRICEDVQADVRKGAATDILPWGAFRNANGVVISRW